MEVNDLCFELFRCYDASRKKTQVCTVCNVEKTSKFTKGQCSACVHMILSDLDACIDSLFSFRCYQAGRRAGAQGPAGPAGQNPPQPQQAGMAMLPPVQAPQPATPVAGQELQPWEAFHQGGQQGGPLIAA